MRRVTVAAAIVVAAAALDALVWALQGALPAGGVLPLVWAGLVILAAPIACGEDYVAVLLLRMEARQSQEAPGYVDVRKASTAAAAVAGMTAAVASIAALAVITTARAVVVTTVVALLAAAVAVPAARMAAEAAQAAGRGEWIRHAQLEAMYRTMRYIASVAVPFGLGWAIATACGASPGEAAAVTVAGKSLAVAALDAATARALRRV